MYMYTVERSERPISVQMTEGPSLDPDHFLKISKEDPKMFRPYPKVKDFIASSDCWLNLLMSKEIF